MSEKISKNTKDVHVHNENIVKVPRNKAFRFEVNETQKFKVKLVTGLAEHKGAELLSDKFYVFSDIKTSIHTFTGCELEVEGECELCYVSEKSTDAKLYDIYAKEAENIETNNILVIGNGSSTTSLTLCNYFVRENKPVTFIELDPSKGNIFPGALTAIEVEKMQFNSFEMSNVINCLFYGSKEVDNIELYELQINALMQNKERNGSRVVLAPFINYLLLDKTIELFNIKKLIVCGDERLHHKIKNSIKSEIHHYFLSTGDAYVHDEKINKSIRRYFNGEELVEVNNAFVLKESLSSSRITLGNPTVVKVGEDYVAPDTALPLNAKRKLGIIGVEEVDLCENAVLAISEATEKEDLATSPVTGFMVCLDEKSGKMLSSQPKAPKISFLIQSNIKYTQ